MSYERFTDRARKVMQLANQEAQRLSHEYVGTEHLLLGLIKEGTGVAACVLKHHDADLDKVRHEVEKIRPTGFDVVVGRLPTTPRVKIVIDHAMTAARDINHNFIGTEHLLLGLLREGEGVGIQVLKNLGLQLEEVRHEVLNLLGYKIDSTGMIKYVASGFADDEQRGEIEEKQVRLLWILDTRFRQVPRDVENSIRSMTDSVALDSYAIHAATCSTMDEFAEAIR